MAVAEVLIHLVIAFFIGRSAGQLCGTQSGAALCPNGRCCSQFGTGNLESQCLGSNTTTSDGIITESLFNQMLKHRDDPRCPGNGFYTYSAFAAAALSFIGFGTTGDLDTRKREVAAFLGQTSHETTGGWASAPDGPYAWGYCYVRESGNPGDYCSPSAAWPCASGQQYYGRGPIQLAYNFNYGEAGKSLGVDLINNPDMVATDAIVSFKTAIWFWMTPSGNGPSCHSVITGLWKPSNADRAGGRLPGYGLITNIISGGSQCRTQEDSRAADRIGFYKRYCDLLGVTYGSNLNCYNQSSF